MPDCLLFQEGFNPYEATTHKTEPSTIILTVSDHTFNYSLTKLHNQIIGARHLVKPGRGIASPLVEVEIIGMPCDNSKYKTQQIGQSVYLCSYPSIHSSIQTWFIYLSFHFLHRLQQFQSNMVCKI